MGGKDLGAVAGSLIGAYSGYKTAVAAGLMATGVGAAYVAAGTLIGLYAGKKIGEYASGGSHGHSAAH
jgi:hypothetical protein